MRAIRMEMLGRWVGGEDDEAAPASELDGEGLGQVDPFGLPHRITIHI